MPDIAGERLHKVLAAAGVASRRAAEALIAAGRVAVDGAVVVEPGTRVDPDRQTIAVDGHPVDVTPQLRYIALNKPVDVVCTVKDRHAEVKVVDLVEIPGVRLVPAGRLDADSEGLVLLSNDGAFVHRVTHPSSSVGKTYRVTVRGLPEAATLRRLANGLVIQDGERPTAPATVKIVARRPTVIEMVLHEGRNRQIRRMMDTVGHPVQRLVRVRIGPVELFGMRPGEWRDLTREEVQAFFADPRPAGRGSRSGQETRGSSSNRPRVADRKGPGKETFHEADHRGGARSGSGKDHRKPVAQRIQVHENRVDRGIPPGGQHHAADRVPGRGRQSLPRPDQRG